MFKKQAHESDLHLIITASQAIPEIEQLLLFGSRAKCTEKPGSDVDLAIKGKAVTYDTVLQLSDRLNEQLPLPYFLMSSIITTFRNPG